MPARDCTARYLVQCKAFIVAFRLYASSPVASRTDGRKWLCYCNRPAISGYNLV